MAAFFLSFGLMLNVAQSATWPLFPVTSSIAPLATAMITVGMTAPIRAEAPAPVVAP